MDLSDLSAWTYEYYKDVYLVKTPERYSDDGYSFEVVARTDRANYARIIALIPRMIDFIRRLSESGNEDASRLFKCLIEPTTWEF